MDPKRAAPADRAEQPVATPPDPGRDSQPASYGPLELRRLRKDDGRALLVYSSPPRQP